MFKLDSPLMNFLNKVCDVMIINLLVIICSIPIFTAGAAITAAYYMCFKMARNEETYIVKGFFTSFKENFKQSTILWLIMLVVAAVLYGDFKILANSEMEFSSGLRIAILAAAVFIILGATFVFPIQARFYNNVKNTLKNSFLMAISHLPSALVFAVSLVVPVLFIYQFPQILPAIVLLVFGALIYGKSFLYLRIFKKYEDIILANEQKQSEGEEQATDAENPEETGDSGIFAASDAMEREAEELKKSEKSNHKFFH